MSSRPKGTLIIIGGREEKATDANRAILEEVSKRARQRKGPLVVIPVATRHPEEVSAEYERVFHDLGVAHTKTLDVRTRDDACDPAATRKIEEASVIFFTGGDQLRITSQVGDSPVYRCLRQIYQEGGTIAGTSAGAAAMPETMIVGGAADEGDRISALGMAPGLGLIDGVVIDSHFAERGRFGRLLGAVAQNPRNLGLGIDENTAIVVEGEQRFQVLGSGSVYVMDGSGISYSSLSEGRPEGVVSIYDVRLHVLREHDLFDLTTRRPLQTQTAIDDEPE